MTLKTPFNSLKTASVLAGITLFLAYFVILLGAATRVWDAGISCPDWPKCYGVWVPFPESHVLPHTPEGYVVNGVHYTTFQVFLEWAHRLLASVVGSLTLALLCLVLSLKERPPYAVKLIIAACVVLAVQIKLGGLTVFLENIHWSVALHLGGAMTFFGLLAATRWRLKQALNTAYLKAPLAPTFLRYGFFGFMALVLVTMLMGAMISTSHAGGVCGGLFNCRGAWWPAETLERWHMLHRFLGISVFIISTLLMTLSKHLAPALHASARGIHVLVWGQVILGILTLYSFSHYAEYYEYISVGHLAWGVLLWLASVGIVCRLTLGDGGQSHAKKD